METFIIQMVAVDRVYNPNGTVLHLKQSKKELFLSKRKVHFWDRVKLGSLIVEHIGLLFAPFYFTWNAFWVALILGVLTLPIGISLSYHRNLSHRSFKLPKYLEYLFAYFGLHAVQGDPMFWVSVHRYHHQFVDTDRDPHSPIEGFWFSHINWVFQHNYLWEKCGKSNNVMDLKKQAYYRFLRRTHALHLLGLALLLYVAGGLPHLIWGMSVRLAVSHHGTVLHLKQSKKELFLSKRKVHFWDRVKLGSLIVEHIGLLFAPFYFTWNAFWVALILGLLTLPIGISLSYHRNLSHRSFKLPKYLEYLFAYFGLHAVQCGKSNNVMDLKKQAYYRFLRRTHALHLLGLALLLYVAGGFPHLIWGMSVRLAVSHHGTFVVNSVCHTWGKRPWNTKDLSKNNWMVGYIAFGEGWHNNHHAFEYSARLGLEWWQLDIPWYFIKLLEYLGVATNVKVPTEIQKRKYASEVHEEFQQTYN